MDSKQLEEYFKPGGGAGAKTRAWADTKGEFTNHCVRLPKGVKFFTPKVQAYTVDIVPYRTKNNPQADPGFPFHYRSYWRHNNLGPDNKTSLPCMLKNFGKPCFACEYVDRHAATMDKKQKDAIKAKVRYLWCLIDLNDREAGIQVFDNAPYKGLGEAIKELVGSKPKYDNFWSLTHGYSLSFVVKEEAMGDGKMKAITRVDADPRDKQYKIAFLDEVPCLDDCLLTIDYEEVKRAMGHGPAADEDEEAPRPAAKSRPAPQDEDDPAERRFPSRPVRDEHLNGSSDPDDDDDRPAAKSRQADPDDGPDDDEIKRGDRVKHRRYGLCTVVKVKDGLLRLEDAEGDVHPEVRPAEVVLVAGEAKAVSAEEEPARGRGRPKKKEAVEDAEDADDQDDAGGEEEDDLPKKKIRKR